MSQTRCYRAGTIATAQAVKMGVLSADMAEELCGSIDSGELGPEDLPAELQGRGQIDAGKAQELGRAIRFAIFATEGKILGQLAVRAGVLTKEDCEAQLAALAAAYQKEGTVESLEDRLEATGLVQEGALARFSRQRDQLLVQRFGSSGEALPLEAVGPAAKAAPRQPARAPAKPSAEPPAREPPARGRADIEEAIERMRVDENMVRVAWVAIGIVSIALAVSYAIPIGVRVETPGASPEKSEVSPIFAWEVFQEDLPLAAGEKESEREAMRTINQIVLTLPAGVGLAGLVLFLVAREPRRLGFWALALGVLMPAAGATLLGYVVEIRSEEGMTWDHMWRFLVVVFAVWLVNPALLAGAFLESFDRSTRRSRWLLGASSVLLGCFIASWFIEAAQSHARVRDVPFPALVDRSSPGSLDSQLYGGFLSVGAVLLGLAASVLPRRPARVLAMFALVMIVGAMASWADRVFYETLATLSRNDWSWVTNALLAGVVSLRKLVALVAPWFLLALGFALVFRSPPGRATDARS